ncbi:hypothetical protein [Nostoc sp. 106C]|jgi:hypothetical protein|uniref:hypothetical protein n=1 Tax=Nostoc sp. 106C TaxID=1932667 RepID=UPI000A38A2F8|nr:hypothetical protein [Nostoc sp. 106C]OUL17877.1 hypothetical protein BV378_37645 [Nostoc sp. RF31YmG]OUL18181.1 hypothetical protein BV375_33940 [Nostoc sp. 106C]
MNKKVQFLVNFYKYAFLGQIKKYDSGFTPDMEEVPIEEANIETQGYPDIRVSSQEQIRSKLIVTINRLLVVVCSVSFFVIIVYPFIYPNKSVPDIIQNAFFTTLGWFGGALGTFFQIERNQP